MDDTAIDLALAEYICTRVCHDLAGPLGAINKGIELLGENNDKQLEAQARDLLAFSAREAMEKLKLFRMALGVTKQQGNIKLDEHIHTLQLYLEPRHIQFDWQGLPQGNNMNASEYRLLLNLIIALTDRLVAGGKLHLHSKANHHVLHATGNKFLLEGDMMQALEGTISNDSLNSKTVQPYFTSRLITQQGWKLAIQKGDNSAECVLTTVR